MKTEFHRKIDDILFQIVFDNMSASGNLDKKNITRVLEESRREFYKHRKLKSSELADEKILTILERSLDKNTPGFGDITRLFDNLGSLYEILVDDLETGSVRVDARG